MAFLAAVIATVLSAAGAQPAPTPALTANQVLAEVQKFYAGITDVSAKFRYTVKNATVGSEKTSDGRVYLTKPGKMRWDHMVVKRKRSTLAKSVISDGTTLYVVDVDKHQFVQQNLSTSLLPVAVAFAYGQVSSGTAVAAKLDASGTYGRADDIVLELQPTTPSPLYKALYFVVDPADYHVTQSIIIDSSDTQHHFRFFTPNFKASNASTLFAFNPQHPNYKQYRFSNTLRPQPTPATTQPATP